ncbi:hypothetical protein IC229_09455 [Spirosoma sp. BT702]|uniref:Lipocalin-like domain-containing protein n=1 Tax=Spirosoma profusum TaxID=2771354 RepID=A0A926XUQ8_9BACT|nr:hypothetical protein [Spirosoma profusum]MBD2700864.1 hypothetical protein [Spirosoma profusum]
MKKILLGCLLALTIVACKKSADAEPEAGATVAGSYQMTLFGLDNGDGKGYSESPLPITTGPITGSGTITTVRKDASSIDLSAKLAITQNGSTSLIIYPATSTSVPVTLQKSGSSYDMMSNGTKIGTADGSTISIDITSPASGTLKSQRVVFKGKK